MLRMICTCLVILTMPQVAISEDDKDKGNTSIIGGIVITGINDFLSSPVGPGPAIQLVGEYNPGGDEPLLVTPSTSEDAILATVLNPVFLGVLGLTPDEFPPGLSNVPLHENAVPVAPSIQVRSPGLRASIAPAGVPARRVEDPITLGDWLDAKGMAIIHCSEDDSGATVQFFFRDLVPKGLYTVWAVAVPPPPPAPQVGFPTAFGGVPNMFTADMQGSAVFRRDVAYCPSDGDLHDITAAYHSDGMVYGNFPDATFDGFPSGIVTHDHVVFLLQP